MTDKPVTPTQANRDCQSPQGDNRNQSPTRDAVSNRVLAEWATSSGVVGVLAREVQVARANLAAAERRVEELTMEYEPESMTPEMWTNWEKHQRARP